MGEVWRSGFQSTGSRPLAYLASDVPTGAVTTCSSLSPFSAKPALNIATIGMSSPSSHTIGCFESLPWSCQVQVGVMTKSPSRMMVRSPSTAV